MNSHLALLLGYSLLLILLGLALGRLVRTTDAFFVAGRRLGGGLLFSTLLAANIGAGSTVGASGIGFADGPSAWWWVGSAGLGSLALAFWVGPRLWREASRHGLQTVGDFLELRYGAPLRGIVASLLWVGTLFALAGQLIAGARVLEVVAGIPKSWGCIAGGAVMTSYFAAGGLLGSAWVNLVQLVVLLGGLLAALPFALGQAGGWEAVVAASPAAESFWRNGTSGWPLLALLGPSFIVSPGLVQKVYGARDERTVRLGVVANAVALLLFAAVPVLFGMIARASFPDLAARELALPQLLKERVPTGLGSLGLAAIFSAEVSSADAILFMLATSLSRDLYLRFVNPRATDTRVLAVARGAALVGGISAVGLAISLDTVVESLTIFYSLMTVCLAVPLVAGVFVPGVRRGDAYVALAAGVTVLLGTQWVTGGGGWAWMSPTFMGLAASLLAFVIARARQLRRNGAD